MFQPTIESGAKSIRREAKLARSDAISTQMSGKSFRKATNGTELRRNGFRKATKESAKRQLTAKSLESLRQLTAIIRSWLRDVLAVCAETPELVINVDARGAIEDAARATDEACVAAALSAVRRCDEAISYNVSPETCIDALLFETRDALYRPRPFAGTGAVR